MKRPQLERWVQQIFRTEPEEISCSECFDLVSQYVDRELAGENVAESLRPVKQHLEQCRACREEYEMLRDFVRAESDDEVLP